jgi:porphobilinogen synthase
MRRLRRTSRIRELMRQTVLAPRNFVYPIFVREGVQRPEPIEAMPGQKRIPPRGVVEEGREVSSLGIPAVILFGIPRKKDGVGSSAYDRNGVVQRAVKALRGEFGDGLVVITDICLCQYTSHGHCGIVGGGKILNDPTLEVLGRVAVSHAEAGVDMVAPSGMMDGQVGVIRRALDAAGYTDVAIVAYATKQASCFYSPFRDAAHSSPRFGDRRSYQMDYANPDEAIREVELDIREGADIVMVKPALACLDLIHRVKARFGMPTAAYSVSGEYSMIKAAAERGWIEEKSAVLETLTAIKRAGADLIITYYAKDASRWLAEK